MSSSNESIEVLASLATNLHVSDNIAGEVFVEVTRDSLVQHVEVLGPDDFSESSMSPYNKQFNSPNRDGGTTLQNRKHIIIKDRNKTSIGKKPRAEEPKNYGDGTFKEDKLFTYDSDATFTFAPEAGPATQVSLV
ncbi:hypothetical protein L6452_09361 [Arctium lappa]|uniref:Uncharacterized protein n=1 Tax=Arctium lappa TaxID=4217 RepID=A0ACB9DJS8_ARCLA|nr:hypothetical protein L6452_09361 [Arctium lappa]